mmetsp:Transcript_2674/g.8315  ORF Transcript_2674/g.8315 Transcript_2674/m.8315 type:complete len:225 (-) Transcript_2674:154-828(-)
MWSDHNGWRSWLRLCDGRPRLFEQFVANVHSEGHGDIVLPLSATACVGCSILCRLAAAGPGGCSGPALPRPRLVYLDAAHEEGETLLEVRRAFELLAPGGVLLGDDWDWPAVRQDVLTFAGGLRPPLPPPTFSAALGLEPVSGGCGVAVAHGGSSGGGGTAQWLLQKPAEGDLAAAGAAAEAQRAVVRLAEALAAGKSDLPELAVWAQAANRSEPVSRETAIVE